MSKKSETKALKKRQMEDKSKQTNKVRTLMIVTGSAFLLLLIIIGLLSNSGNDEQTGSLNVPYAEQPVMGDPNAPISITEFGDFKCPACKAFTEEYFPSIKKDYIDTGIAKFYFMNNAFIGPDSYTAAAAGEAVHDQNEKAFWPFMEAVYKHQGLEKQVWATPEFLVSLAKQEKLEINYDQLAKDLQAGTYDSQVQADVQFANNSGITSTPTILVNGKQVSDPFDYNEIKKLIEEELKGTPANGQK